MAVAAGPLRWWRDIVGWRRHRVIHVGTGIRHPRGIAPEALFGTSWDHMLCAIVNDLRV